MEPLAAYRISQVKSVLEEVQTACTQLSDEEDALYSTCCLDVLDEAIQLLEMAEQFYASGNYMAANYYALEALTLLQKIQECYKP